MRIVQQRFYKISEFAKLVGVTPTTLREWERRGWLLPHHRSPSGYRFYSDEQLQRYLSGEIYMDVQSSRGGVGNV